MVPSSQRFRGTVLVVEDDEEVRELSHQVLSSHGYCAIRAADGRAAVSVLSSFKVDLILLDLVMPGMDGWEFLAARRSSARYATIPVVVLTGLGSGADRIALADCAAVVGKPFSSDELLTAVARHCPGPETAKPSLLRGLEIGPVGRP